MPIAFVIAFATLGGGAATPRHSFAPHNMTLQDPITLLVTGGIPEASLGLCCFLQSLGGPLGSHQL